MVASKTAKSNSFLDSPMTPALARTLFPEFSRFLLKPRSFRSTLIPKNLLLDSEETLLSPAQMLQR